MTAPILRLASRGSPLALAQARLTRNALARAHGWDRNLLDQLCPIITIKTSGDAIQDRPLADAGGKGLFVKEIEEALIAREADIAVHSMKDMPAVLPLGLDIAAVLPREDPRDILIAKGGLTFEDLDDNARLGTSSVRRTAQALRLKPNLEIVPLRGNVETRLAKLARGQADAIVLARAGISRLNLALPDAEILDWLPALCQGAIGIEIRDDDSVTRDLVSVIDDAPTHLAIACERGFLAELDGSCRTPIAGLATLDGDTLRFKGEVLGLDGRTFWAVSRDIRREPQSDAAARETAFSVGEDAAREIREMAGVRLPRD